MHPCTVTRSGGLSCGYLLVTVRHTALSNVIRAGSAEREASVDGYAEVEHHRAQLGRPRSRDEHRVCAVFGDWTSLPMKTWMCCLLGAGRHVTMERALGRGPNAAAEGSPADLFARHSLASSHLTLHASPLTPHTKLHRPLGTPSASERFDPNVLPGRHSSSRDDPRLS